MGSMLIYGISSQWPCSPTGASRHPELNFGFRRHNPQIRTMEFIVQDNLINTVRKNPTLVGVPDGFGCLGVS